jgi:hypothetical protein
MPTKQIQQHFDGFLQTPCLWKSTVIYGLNQFEIDVKSVGIDLEIDTKLRLGKYVERFVSYQLAQEKNIEILAENIQIQRDKITLGELDCLLLKNKQPIHLEVIYKFYLYDSSIGTSEIDHFIGPNRKDSLVEKLTKLRDKQLPLLYDKECKTYLKSLGLNALDIRQQVYFKAQLFLPFSNQNIQFKEINQHCVIGFYLYHKEITQLKDRKFYIPTKKDWLVIPHTHVKWLTFNEFQIQSDAYVERKFSPMVWVKSNTGTLHKIFLVWW